jgi:hypothetical protein
MTYMAVNDIRKAESETSMAGGAVMRPSTAIPGVGKLAVVTDTTGALIGLIEPEDNHALAGRHH